MSRESKDRKYAEMLNVIANTCLLFNDRSELGQHIDYNMEANNASSMNSFRRKSTFCELSNEVGEWYGREFDLERLLDAYKEVSDVFVPHFKRSYSMDLQDLDECQGKKEQQIFKMLNYLYADDKEKALDDLRFLGDSKRCVLASWMGADNSNCYYALFLLMMIGVLPTYNSKKGAAVKMGETFRLLMDFLRRYGLQAPIDDIARDAPILTGFETRAKGGEEKLTRIDLIHMTYLFLNVIQGYSSPDAAFRFNQQFDLVFFDLEGIWTDSEIAGTRFWQFEELANGYYLHEYRQVSSDGRYELQHTQCECYLYDAPEGVSFFVCHPSMMKRLVNYQRADHLREWGDCEFSYDETPKTKQFITKIDFQPTIRTHEALLPARLFRVKDDAVYMAKLDRYPIRNMFPEDEYHLFFRGFAVTNDFLYVALSDEDCRKMSVVPTERQLFLKVPKSLDENLLYLTLSDGWGMCDFVQGDIYFAVPNSLLFYKVTRVEDRKNLGVEVVDTIFE